MKTFTFKTQLGRNPDVQSLLKQINISDIRWVIFGGDGLFDTVIFSRDGTLLITDGCKRTPGLWRYNGEDALLITFPNAEFRCYVLFLDRNLFVLQNEETKECLILLATSTMNELNLKSLESIERYILLKRKQYQKGDADFWNCPVPHQVNIVVDEVYDDDFEEDDEFSEYGGLTKEEVIYDYLQREEEEQAEEDYYLEQMREDD